MPVKICDQSQGKRHLPNPVF